MPQAPYLPQECFASLHKAPLFSSGLNLKLLSVLCVPVWGGGAGGEVAREKGRQEKEGGADSRTFGSLFTLEPPPPAKFCCKVPGAGLLWTKSSHILWGRGCCQKLFIVK